MSHPQLILGLIQESPPPLHQLVRGPNAEVWSWLWRIGQGEAPPGHRLLVWGAPGSGKSAALRAVSQQFQARERPHHLLSLRAGGGRAEGATCTGGGEAAIDAVAAVEHPLLIDNLECASPALQQAVFARLVAEPRAAVMVATSGYSLRELAAAGALREDLQSRLAQGLAYPLAPLDEPEQLFVLRQKAHGLGWTAQPEDTQFDAIFLYMLKRMPRHLGWLCGLLQAVDRAALAQQRPVSVALLRSVAEDYSTPFPSQNGLTHHDPSTPGPL